MRIVIDEDIPRELTSLFRGSGHTAAHVEDLDDDEAPARPRGGRAHHRRVLGEVDHREAFLLEGLGGFGEGPAVVREGGTLEGAAGLLVACLGHREAAPEVAQKLSDEVFRRLSADQASQAAAPLP